MISVFFSALGIDGLNKNTHNEAVGTEQNYGSYYLIGEDKIPYRVDTDKYTDFAPAGSASGYSTEEVIGQENFTITATASSGYQLVGWKIEYTERINNGEQPGTHEYIDLTSFLESSKILYEQVGTSTIAYTLTKTDANFDRLCDSGSLTISRVAENLNIIPVFDYVYYSLDISSIFNLRASSGENAYTTTDNELFYTAIEQTEDGVDCYKNAVLNDNEVYYYLGDVYYVNNAYCTKHAVLSTEGGNQYMPVETGNRLNGAFRVTEEINLDVAFNVAGEYNNLNSYKTLGGINIDFTGVNIVTDEAVVELEDNYFNVTKQHDSENVAIRSTGVNVNLTLADENLIEGVMQDKDKTLVLSAEYANLYLVEFNPYIDNELIDMDTETDAIKRLVLDSVLVDYSYYKFSSKYYLAKNAEDNLGRAFTVAYQNVISARDNNNRIYNYYTFASISRTDYSGISANIVVDIKYTSYEYAINFVPVLYANNSITMLNDITVHQDVKCARGKSATIDETFFMSDKNIGYEPYGLTEDINLGVREDKSLSVQIAEQYPTNKTVYVIYTYKVYTVTVQGLDSISLYNGLKDVYPVRQMALVYNNDFESVEHPVDSKLETISFATELNIDSLVQLRTAMNNGFVFGGYSVGDISSLSSQFSFYIKDVVKDSTTSEIIVNITERFSTYYLEFGADIASIGNGEHDFMADIMLDIISSNGATKNVTLTTFDEIDEPITPSDDGVQEGIITVTNGDNVREYTVTILRNDNRHSIRIDNLHLYEQVKLFSKGREVAGKEGSFYQFNKFTEGGSITLSATPETNDYYSHTEVIVRDIVIDVVYSSPSTILILGINNARAFDLQNLIVETADGLADLVIDENNRVTTELSVNDTIKVRFGASINFGYKFDHFLFRVNENSESSTTLPGTFTLTDEEIHYLDLYFDEIEYRLVVKENGGGVGHDNDAVVMFGSANYLPITVSTLNVTFEMPNGYYVDTLGFVKGGSMAPLVSNQDNTYSSTLFDFDIPLDNFANIMQAYGYTNGSDDYTYLDLRVNYKIHTYSFTINFGISNAKGGGRDEGINFPKMDISITPNLSELDDQIIKEETNNSVIFKNIPYGKKIVATLNSVVDAGFRLYGWTDSNFVKLQVTPQDMIESSNVVITLESLTINSIEANAVYGYQISYIEYRINLVKEGVDRDVDIDFAGNPTVTIAGKNSSIIKQNDSLYVSANASKTYGYTHHSIKYTTYRELTNDELDAEWGLNWNRTIYYLANGEYHHPSLASDKHPELYTYYIAEEISFNAGNITDTTFNILNYYLDEDTNKNKTNIITITIVYDYLKINLNQSNKLVGELSLVAGAGEGAINVPVEDFVKNYSVSVLNYQGDIKEFDPNATDDDLTKTKVLNYRDRVLIYIKLNDAEGIDGVSYSLRNGVTLNYVEVMNNNHVLGVRELEGNENYDYLFEFNVGEFLILLGEDDTIYLKYAFEVQTKTITLKTNVEDPAFYYDNGQIVRLSISETIYRFGEADILLQEGQIEISSTLQYLAKSRLSYDLGTFNSYFRIKEFKVYDMAGNLIEDYSNLGVFAENPTIQGNISGLLCRYVDDIVIELTVQPIISFHGQTSIDGNNVVFETDYRCQINNGQIEGIAQSGLSFGTGASFNIDLASTLSNLLELKYYLNGIEQLTMPINANSYEVRLSFKESERWQWLKGIKLEYQISYKINPLEMNVRINQQKVKEDKDNGFDYFFKQYDGTSALPANLILQDYLNLVISTKNGEIIVPYTDKNIGLHSSYFGRITYNNGGGEIDAINADVAPRNIEITNLTLKTSNMSKNFSLASSGVIRDIFYINKKDVSLSNLVVKDKMYDGERSVEVKNPAGYKINGIIPADQSRISLNYDLLNLRFNTPDVGQNKPIEFNVAGVLTGSYEGDPLVNNYQLASIGNLTATIYPDRLTQEVEGIGRVTVVNRRAIHDDSKVNLIPCDAELVVDVIRANTTEYNRLYKNLADYLNNNSTFNYGLRLRFKDKNGNGTVYNISNELYLELPVANKLKDAIWLTTDGDGASGLVVSAQEGEKLVIDLSSSPKVDVVVLTQQRTMFKWWQILIIVLIIVLILLAVLIGYLIKRKKQLSKYRRNDKI